MKFLISLIIALMFTTSAYAQLKYATIDNTKFPQHEKLNAAVDFWRDMFSKHTSYQIVVHDRDDLSVVWAVITLPVDKYGKVNEAVVPKFATKVSLETSLRLQRLEGNPNPLDDEDKALLESIKYNKELLAGASNRVRIQRGVADKFSSGIERAAQWMPSIKEALIQEGVPVELAALPFIESMYLNQARSHVGAAGIWQIMPSTGRSLGLKVSRHRDDRMDVHRATRAAAKLLADNYRQLKHWPLAITAYNHGVNGIKRAVSKTGSSDIVQLIEQYDSGSWGFASRNFYVEFLAAYSLVGDHFGLKEKKFSVPMK